MKCEKCNSENVQAQVITKKNTITTGIVLLLGGLGLMFLGIVGGVIGVLIGLPIGAIVKGLMGDIQETVFVCQECGNTFKPKDFKVKKK